MVAATGYLAFALTQGALAEPYGRMIFTALCLSWVGDLLLVGDGRAAFLAGLSAFLVAHLAYATAFTVGGVEPLPVLVGGAIMLAVAVAVMRWLYAARLPSRLRLPVAAYLAAIGAMVALATGTLRPVVILGAVAFVTADVFVARQRFVVRASVNRLVGLPLYFAAQLLLASSA
jgi:uncharacterized membrane protein YhhN